ncbi:hypothetical protein RhiirB3_441368 [Rhizophagus irregularis]|nr:hypothetical protein RhiirB3_441368 [Rhizophagus irregularis]
MKTGGFVILRADCSWYQYKFQQNLKNWSSGNHEVDKLIQKVQPKAKDYNEILGWIEYGRFENVEFLAKGGFGTIYKAIWKDGYIRTWNSKNNQWRRKKGSKCKFEQGQVYGAEDDNLNENKKRE